MLRAPSDFFQWPLALTVLGCSSSAGPPAEVPDERDVSLREVVETQRTASELALVAELLARSEPIHHTPAASNYAGPVACEKVSRGPLYQTLSLRFGPGERPFGVFSSGTLRVVVPESSHRPRAFYVTSDNGGLVVHGAIDPSELELYPSAPTGFGGFVVVGTKTRIALESASPLSLTVRHELESSDAVTTTLPQVRGSVTCEELDLVPGREEAEDGFFEPVIETKMLLRSKRIPLALDPGGRVVTHLRVEEPVCVGVLENAGQATRVVIGRSDDLLFGWVPTDALGPADSCILHGHVRVLGHSVGTATGGGFDRETARCPGDVPIEVEHAGMRRRVGFVRAGTLMRLDDFRGQHVAIDVHRSNVKFAPDAKLLVLRSALEACELRLEPKLLERSHRPFAWPRRPVSGGRTRR